MEPHYPTIASSGTSNQKTDNTVPLQETETEINRKDDQVFLPAHKVLQNDLLLSVILNHLSFEDIKQCRLVSWRWKNECERSFGKSAKLCVTPSELQSLSLRDVEINRFITDLKIIGLPEQEVAIPRDSNIDLTSFIPPHITNLCVDTKCIRSLPMDGLLSFKRLVFVHPIDLIFNGNKISPEKLSLYGATYFIKDGKKDEEGLINNYVDFDQMSFLELPSSVSLDMSENRSIHTIELKGSKITSWENSKWSMRIAYFINYCYSQKTQMNIKNLVLCRGHVDLSCLPDSLERLVLVLYMKVRCTAFLHLPHLKCLQLCNTPKCFQIGWIPPSVTRIHVYGNYFLGEGEFHVETLVVERKAISEVEQILQLIKPRNLTIMFTRDLDSPFFEQDQAFADFLKNSTLPSITVLGFLWLNGDFHKSPLAKIVDRQSWSYEFKNGKGVASNLAYQTYSVFMLPVTPRPTNP